VLELVSRFDQPPQRPKVWLPNRREQLKKLEGPLPSPQRLPLVLHPMRRLLRRTSLISTLQHTTPSCRAPQGHD